jgi:catechol 2,3-dioxygenase-like lactoylglutathione lyase family enzyme
MRRVLETALYVDDLKRAVAFYRDVMGMRPMGEPPRLVPMDAGGGTVLLLFERGSTGRSRWTPERWANGKRSSRRTAWRSRAA